MWWIMKGTGLGVVNNGGHRFGCGDNGWAHVEMQGIIKEHRSECGG